MSRVTKQPCIAVSLMSSGFKQGKQGLPGFLHVGANCEGLDVCSFFSHDIQNYPASLHTLLGVSVHEGCSVAGLDLKPEKAAIIKGKTI